MVNIELSLITPPFGMNLFVLKRVSPPDVTLGAIYRGVISFVLINIALALVMLFPPIAIWLPGLMG